MSSARIAFVAVVLLVLTACGTAERCDAGCAVDVGAADAGPADAGSATPVQFCVEVASAQFAVAVRCGALTPAGAAELQAIEVTRCATDVSPGLASGRVRYEPANARACVASIERASCTTPDLYAACGSVFSGTVGLDGECLDSSECDGASFCDLGAACPGRCRPRVAVGQPSTGECVAGAYGYADRCSAFVARGESCSAVAPSTELRRCEPGHRCDDRRVCVSAERQALGQACASGLLECGEGLQCVSDVCVPLANVGASCGVRVACRDDLVCSAAMVCVARGDVGSRCASATECRPSLFCALPNGGGAGVCASDRLVGQQCTFDGDECASGLFCTAAAIGQSGACREPGQVGASCSADGHCLSNRCTAGTCAAAGCP